MKTLLAIDGNSIINRAFYGVRPLSNREGLPTNALFGFVNIIAKQLEERKPDYAAIAFDVSAPTFRHAMYDAYKAGRKPMPEELKQQMPYAKEVAKALGLHVLELKGYEADDILGTLADMADKSDDLHAFILTGDRDSLQLIDEKVTVLLATNTDTVVYDTNAYYDKYGVMPTQCVDVKALMGDSSDHIPGVPGIGEKSAFSLIAKFGTLDAVYENLEDPIIKKAMRAKLESGKESAYMSKELATICREVPLGITLSDIRTDGIDRKHARALFTQLEFSSFLKRFDLNSETPEVSADEKRHAVLVTESISGEQLLKLPREAHLAVSMEDQEHLLLCAGCNLYSASLSDTALKELLEDENRHFACYDYKTLYGELVKKGIGFRCTFDVMLAAYALDASGKFELPSLVMSFLGETMREEVKDVQYIAELEPILYKKLHETEQWKVFTDIEMPLATVLSDMEAIGFKIDCDGIRKYGEELEILAKELEQRIFYAAGGPFNVKSTKQLAEVLFEKLGLPATKKTKSGYSTDAEVLEKLRPYHPIIEDILDFRQVTKLKSTYVDGLLKVAGADGRVHTVFRQTGTATGRLSSAEPNLQNIPIRTEMGRQLRRYFVAKSPDYVLLDADYSQIELRLLAHIAGDEKMREAFIHGMDIHTSTAANIFHVAPEQVTLDMRKKAKAINFGIMYGMGEYSLSQDLHISRAQAKEYIENYLHNFPKVDQYLKDIVKEGYEHGYVKTMFGRRRYIPELSGQNRMIKSAGERIAMNSPIQGTAADIIKLAMIGVHRKLSESGLDAKLILQVHDELLLEVRKDQAEEAMALLKDQMEHAVTLSVPLDVGSAMGENWYDAK